MGYLDFNDKGYGVLAGKSDWTHGGQYKSAGWETDPTTGQLRWHPMPNYMDPTSGEWSPEALAEFYRTSDPQAQQLAWLKRTNGIGNNTGTYYEGFTWPTQATSTGGTGTGTGTGTTSTGWNKNQITNPQTTPPLATGITPAASGNTTVTGTGGVNNQITNPHGNSPIASGTTPVGSTAVTNGYYLSKPGAVTNPTSIRVSGDTGTVVSNNMGWYNNKPGSIGQPTVNNMTGQPATAQGVGGYLSQYSMNPRQYAQSNSVNSLFGGKGYLG